MRWVINYIFYSLDIKINKTIIQIYIVRWKWCESLYINKIIDK